MGLTPFWSHCRTNCSFSHFRVGFTRASGRLVLGIQVQKQSILWEITLFLSSKIHKLQEM